MDEQIKTFSENFFKNLNCEIEWKDNALFVRNVPGEFEKLSGKEGPYILVFDSEVDIDGAEVMTAGSYLLKIMNKYLESVCQTSLLKINFDIDAKKEIEDRFSLMNCDILKVDVREKFEFFTRFTFRTVFQHLNEREQEMHTIFVKDGEIVDFYLTSYDTSEGSEDDIPSEEVKKDYVVAKGRLKSLLDHKTKSVSEGLQGFLKKEVDRIEGHYSAGIKEIEDKLEGSRVKIEELKAGKFDGKVQERIIRLREGIKEIEDSGELEKLKKEEKFFLNDEIQKHSLNIKNKLMNTTVIYYPIFHYSVLLSSGVGKKVVELEYNPMKREFGSVNCDNCFSKLDEFIVCSSGHLTCRECGDRCGSCEEVYCKKCNVVECALCGRIICPKCTVRCFGCRKSFCKDHVREVGGRMFCINCIKKCKGCGREVEPSGLRDGLCEGCYVRGVSAKVVDDIFGKEEW